MHSSTNKYVSHKSVLAKLAERARPQETLGTAAFAATGWPTLSAGCTSRPRVRAAAGLAGGVQTHRTAALGLRVLGNQVVSPRRAQRAAQRSGGA